MAKFLTTRGTAAEIEELIRRAVHQLILVSPFWQFPDDLHARLLEADARGVSTTFVFRATKLDTTQQAKMEQLSRAQLLGCEALHAKCYCNDNTLIISSLNIYAFSERNNREMGILLREGEEAYEDALREVRSLLSISVPVSLDRGPAEATSAAKAVGGGLLAPGWRTQDGGGFCIRCRQGVPRDPERPFCRACFFEWAIDDDPDYPRDFCHACGQRAETSHKRPLCRTCYGGAGRARSSGSSVF